jgi:hypothetical protein
MAKVALNKKKLFTKELVLNLRKALVNGTFGA